MPKFELERSLVSCRITKDTLVRLENVVRQKAVSVGGLSEEQVRKNYSVVINDKYGTETLSTIGEMSSDRFSNSTIAIRMSLSSYQPRLEVQISFGRSRHGSSMRVQAEGRSPREDCLVISDNISRTLEPDHTYCWLLHPTTALLISASAVVLVVNVVLLALKCNYLIPLVLSAAHVLGILFFALGAYLQPYTKFESQWTPTADKIWNWWLVGFATFVVFGTALTALRRHFLKF